MISVSSQVWGPLNQGPARVAVGLSGVSEQQCGPFAAGHRAPFFGGTAGPVTASRAPQPAGCGETAQVEGRVCPCVSLSEQLRLWALWVLRVSSDLGIKRKPMK